MSPSALPLPLPPGAAPTLQRRDLAAPRPASPAATNPLANPLANTVSNTASNTASNPAPNTAPSPPPSLQRPGRPQADLAPAERRWLIVGVTGLHLALLWGLLQMGTVHQALREVAPLMVDFISVEAPPKPVPAPPKLQRQQPPRSTPLPVVVAAPVPQAPPAPTAFLVPEPVPVQAAPTAPSPVAVVAAPAPAAAPALAPKPVAASALRYAVLPPVEMPLASRRLGESGTVLLRVVFDTQGRVKQASVHRSSGFARLDEQALAAMRQARITPFVDNGAAIEVSAIAPLAYELD